MRKLIPGCAAAAAVYGTFYLHPSPSPPVQDWRDDVWISLVTGTFAIAAVVMLLARIPWTWRGVGLFLTSIATAAFYGATLWTRRGDGAVGTIPETWVDLIRSLYVVGGPLLLYGLIDWLGGWWRDRRQPPSSPDAIDVTGTGPTATAHRRRWTSDWEGRS